MADRTGLYAQQISQLERDLVRRPRSTTVEYLAEALKLEAPERATFVAAARGRARDAPVDERITHWRLNQLPPDTADFTGRLREASLLEQLLISNRAGAVVIAAVSGRGGVGKSTLAVHAAHHLRNHFSDGQLYVNLRGIEPRPREPAEVLASLLGCLGIDSRSIPDDLDARVELYRVQLAGRRVLVVLDNAADERQVRPLLPGSPPCAAIVTSRACLVGLEGAWQIEIDMMGLDEAVQFLGRVAGADRVNAEPAAALEIVRLCDRLPLAVRIAGARLAVRRHWRLAHLASRLQDEHRRLDELAQGDLAVRASCALSYAGLSELQQCAFRRLALLDAPDFPAWVAAALLDLPARDGDDLLGHLCDAHLLEVTATGPTEQTRFHCHDLLRLFARERCFAEDPAVERHLALTRALDGWTQLTAEAELRLLRRDASNLVALRWQLDRDVVDMLLSDPLVWFEMERPALVSEAVQAAEAELSDLACNLAAPMATYLSARALYDDFHAVHGAALEAARRARNVRAEAVLERGLGDLHTAQDRYDEAIACFRRALPAYRAIGDRHGEAAIHYSIGSVLRLRSCYSEALAHCQAALTMSSAVGDRHVRVHALISVANIQLDRGWHKEARSLYEEALTEARKLRYRQGDARALSGLALVHETDGQLETAEAVYEQARHMWREVGDRRGQARILQGLGGLYRQQGRLNDSGRALDECLAFYREVGDRFNSALTLLRLGELRRDEGQLTLSIECLDESRRTFRQLRLPLWQARALRVLAGVLVAAGDERAARAVDAEALALVGEMISSTDSEGTRLQI